MAELVEDIEQPQVQEPTDKTKILYDAVSKKYDVGSYDEFSKKLQDPAKRKSFYDGVGHEYELGTYDEFTNKVGAVKKKDTPLQSSGIPTKSITPSTENNAGFLDQNTFGTQPTKKVNPSVNVHGVAPVSDNNKPDMMVALTNTSKSILKSQGQEINTANLNRTKEAVSAGIKQGKYSLTTNKDGEPIYGRSPSMSQSFTKGLLNKMMDWEDAIDIHKNENNSKQLAATLDSQIQRREDARGLDVGLGDIMSMYGNPTKMAEYFATSSTEPMGEPTGLSKAAQMAGGLAPDMLVNTLGTGAIATSTMLSASQNKMKELYDQRYKELKQKGISDQEAKEQAAVDAKTHAPLAAFPEALTNTLMFRGTGGISPAAKNFGEALVNITKSSTKLGLMGAASEAATQGIESTQGYKTDDFLKKIKESGSEWFLQTAMLEGLMHLPSLPKYGQAALKEFAIQPENQHVVDATLQSLPPEKSAEITTDLNNYKTARKSVEGLVPEEHMPTFAGLMEKRNNLEQSKEGKSKALTIPIDDEIKSIDDRLATMQKTGKVNEVDDLTGQPINPTKTHDELSKKEREGIIVPKEYGEATVREVGEGENKRYEPIATYKKGDGRIMTSHNIKVFEGENPFDAPTYTDKEKAQKEADEALGKHYYENAMPEHEKPLAKEITSPKIKNDGNQETDAQTKEVGTESIKEGAEKNTAPSQTLMEQDAKENEIQQSAEGQSNPVAEINPIEQPTSQTKETSSNKVGVSHNSLTDLYEKLGLGEVERGKRDSPEEMRTRGRLLYNSGADIEQLEKSFKDGKQPTQDDVSVARVHLEHLTKVLDAMGKKFGIDSRQYKEAKNEVARWNKEVVKPMGTEVGKAFTALQGETDLDTDSFSTVQRKVEDTTGKPATPKENAKIKELTEQNSKLKVQAEELDKKLIEQTDKGFENKESEPKNYKEKAKKVADSFRKLKTKEFTFKDENGNDVPLSKMGISWNDLVEIGAKAIEKTGEIADGIKAIVDEIRDTEFYKKLSDKEKDNLEKQLTDHYSLQNKKESSLEALQEKYSSKIDNRFTIEEAKEIWEYMKDVYLNKDTHFVESVDKTSKDLGLKVEQVMNAIVTPKSKPLSLELYKNQYNIRKGRQAVEQYIENKKPKSELANYWKKATAIPRAISTAFHGHIFAGTHYPMGFVTPSQWGTFFKSIQKMWQSAYGSIGKHEQSVRDLMNDKNYWVARKSGLENDAEHIGIDDFERSGNVLGKLGQTGTKGFFGLKWLRQQLFNNYWESTKPEERNEEVAKSISWLINNATGATNMQVPKAIQEGMFSSGMEGARWGRLVRNPADAAVRGTKILNNMAKGKPIDAADKAFVKVWSKRAGEQVATMLGLLALNSFIQSKVNPKNPVNLTDPSKPDWFKLKIGNTDVDLTGGVLGIKNLLTKIGTYTVKDKNAKQRAGDIGSAVLQYTRGKLSPAYGDITEPLFGTDYAGNPLPFSNVTPSAGKHRLSWGEYIAEKSPIFMADVAKNFFEGADENGIPQSKTEGIVNGLIQGGIKVGLGVHATPSFQLPTPYTEEDYKKPVFKFFKDKGLELPNTSLSSIQVVDKDKNTEYHISDYPKEVQDEFQSAHKEYLENILQRVQDNGKVFLIVRKTKDGEKRTISLKQPNDDNAKEIELNDLSKDDLTQVLHLAQSEATKKSKKQVFNIDTD